MKKIGKILLLGKKSYLVDKSQKIYHTEFGMINLGQISKYGQAVKTNTGEKFFAVEPTLIDLMRKCKRMPQIITTKDAGQIAAVTGVSSGWQCVDFGGGSGFLAVFLGNLVQSNGSVTTYEKNKKYAENIEKNIRFCGLDGVVKVKNKDASRFDEKNLDIITLDIINAEKYIKKCYNALKPGGWICCYSPHIEQQKNVADVLRKHGFSETKTIETIQRTWQVSDHTHPIPSQLVHTGFMTFARKVK